MKNLSLLCFLVVWGFAPSVLASDQGVKEYALLGGWVLPDQVPGMEDILPTWGVRAGWGVGPQTLLSATYLNALSKGVGSHQLNLEARYSTFSEGVIGYLSAGASLLHYNSYMLESAQQELGVLMGTGFLFQVSQEMWIQSEMQFHLEPGVQLKLILGLAMRL